MNMPLGSQPFNAGYFGCRVKCTFRMRVVASRLSVPEVRLAKETQNLRVFWLVTVQGWAN